MNPIVRRVIVALSTAAAVVLAIVHVPTRFFPPVFAALAALALLEFVLLLRRKVPLSSACGVCVLLVGCAVIGGAFLFALPEIALRHGNMMLLFVIAVVKVGDMGGFALGVSTAKLMRGGNHKLCPSISPNKSWEGLFGSVLAACILSLLFMPTTQFGWWKALAFGAAAALVGTFGDLVESKFKRWVGVKDSATFMPAGLGGFLDMFDSLLLAPAVLLPFI